VPVLLLAAYGCASSGSTNPEPRGFESVKETGLLETYREMGLLVGPDSFPVIGRIVYLRGPADSTLVGFAASIPSALLRFAREGDLFAANYLVSMLFSAGPDTVLRLSRREVVRVESFAETERTDESVIFQRFVALPPGQYTAALTVRELSSRYEAFDRLDLDVPSFTSKDHYLSWPLVAYRAAARSTYDQTPPLILAPRSTIAYTTAPALVVIENYSDEPGPVTLEAMIGDQTVWLDTLEWQLREKGPASGLSELPLYRLPPGPVTLRATVVTSGEVVESPLLVAGSDEWVFSSFEQALPYFAYAVDGETLAAWREAEPLSRSLLWEQFWRASDSVPSTASNEFLREYFERMTVANRRFLEGGIPGWQSDRGRAFVQLGDPDRELLHPPRITGQNTLLEWVYEESLPFPVQLFFEATDAFGTYRLTSSSSQVLSEAVRRLHRERREAGSPDASG
jgi:GWxTD domain-containing protein